MTGAREPVGSALAGRTVVVTRAGHQAAELTAELRARGAHVIHLPLIAIDDPLDAGASLAAALGALDAYDWLVVTSPNGAARVAEAVAPRPPGRPALAVVGEATARALGRAPDLVASPSTAADLVAAFPRGQGRVLLAQGDRAGPDAAEGLRARGWEVDVRTAYRTTTVVPHPADAVRAATADAVLLASGSAAEAWAAAVGPRSQAAVVAIGPSTAAVARRCGIALTAVARDHSTAGLVATLEDSLRQGR